MKSGNFIIILVVLALIACFVTPVMADVNKTTDLATTLYNSGETHLFQGDYQGAITLYDQALASNLTNLKLGDGLLYVYRDKGYALIQLNKTDEAIQTTNEGLALYGTDAMLWNNKGYALTLQGKFQDALVSYNNALTYGQNPTISSGLIDNNAIVQILNNKGDVLCRTGQFQGAVDTYNEALSLSPGNPYATNGLALAQKSQGLMGSPLIIIIVIILIAAAGSAVWYVKFRKPAETKQEETKKARKGKK